MILLLCAAADPAASKRVVLILPEDPLSLPYQEAARAIQSDLLNRALEGVVVRLPRKSDAAPNELARRLTELEPDCVVAIGSLAFTAVQATAIRCPLIYTMVLNPGRIMKAPGCIGVSLDIPPSVLMGTYRALFRDHRRVGVTFSPEHSSELVRALNDACAGVDLELVARGAGSREDALRAQESLAQSTDGVIIIADPVTASPEVVDAVLQQCLPLNKPVIGLKSSEVQKGAAFAFLLDYESIGHQTTALAVRVMNADAAAAESPRLIGLSVNRNVLERLSLREPYSLNVPVMQVFPTK